MWVGKIWCFRRKRLYLYGYSSAKNIKDSTFPDFHLFIFALKNASMSRKTGTIILRGFRICHGNYSTTNSNLNVHKPDKTVLSLQKQPLKGRAEVGVRSERKHKATQQQRRQDIWPSTVQFSVQYVCVCIYVLIFWTYFMCFYGLCTDLWWQKFQ